MEINVNEVPSKYLENRETIEGRVVLSMWKNPELFMEYKINNNELINEDSKVLYKLGLQMVDNGIVEFDRVTVETYLEDYPTLKEIINEYGGVREIINTAKTMNVNNFETYYDKLLQSNYMINLFLMQKRLASEFEKIKGMNDSQLMANYVEELINSISDESSINKNMEVNELYFADDEFDMIVNGEAIETVTFEKYAKILNDIFYGIPMGMTTQISAPSGNGKSTFTFSNILYPMIEKGEIVTLISNELSYQQYKFMLYSIIATRQFKYYKLSREKMLKGKCTEEDLQVLRQVQKYVNTELKGKLVFIKYCDGDIDTIIRIMNKWNKMGSRIVVFDTMKASNSADNRAWATIIEDSKKLDIACQKNKQGLILTFQIAQYASNKRELSGADLSQGKQIKEILSNHAIFRYLHADEYTGEKYDVKPYRWKYDEALGKTYKEQIKLDKDKRYLVLYVDKCRNGQDGIYILYQFNGQTATYYEIGYCTVHPDSQRN